MDVYEPAGDVATKRPVVFLAFGGSFISGDRTQLSALGHYYATQGYVAACIDYRLYDGPFIPFPDSLDMVDVVVKSVSDMKAAVRFMRKDAATTNQFKIDPDWIFVGGASAGGICAAHTAYLSEQDTANIPTFVMDAINANGGWEGNSNTDTTYSSAVNGVLNYSGALARAEWISNGDPSLFSVHDDQDGVVPYGNGYASVGFGGFSLDIIYMEGSETMEMEASAKGVYNELITIPNSNGHVSYLGDPMWEDSVLTSSSVFMYNILCQNAASVEAIGATSTGIHAYPNPSNTIINIELEEVPSAYAVQVVDMAGRVVYQQSGMRDYLFSLNRSDFGTGMYFVRLVFEDKNRLPITQKVIFTE